MKTISSSNSASVRMACTRSMAFGLALLVACSASLADKPEWAGNGKNKGDKGENHGQMEQGQTHRGNNGKNARKGGRVDEVRIGGFFGEPQRVAANTYYGQQFSSGHCPPGLAKKNNGCLPPGQAKKYSIGQPLPRGVIYYPVAAPVLVQLGVAPAGHKYVRVASDILLIAIGTGMVVDAIQDLGRV